MDSDSDNDMLYRDSAEARVNTGMRVAPGTLFHWLDARDPHRARRRFGNIYWRGWQRFVLSFFLFVFGSTFLFIGLACMRMCDDFDRGVAFFIVGLIMFMPGMYGMTILVYYVRGRRGYSYKQLPDMQ